jgi:outer membrane protein TolC
MVLFLLLLFAGGARADSSFTGADPNEVLESLLREALRSSPAIAASSERATASGHRAAAADRLPSPMFGFGYMPGSGGMSSASWISLRQTFPFFGKRSLMRSEMEADAAMDASRTNETAAMVVQDVKENLWAIYRADRAIEIAEREAAVLSEMAAAAQAMYSAGEGRQADVFQAQFMQTEVDERLIRLRGERAALERRIEGLVGKPLPIPFLAETDPEIPIDESALEDRAFRANPEIAARDAEVRRSRASLALASKDLYPDLTLGAMWGEMGMGGMPGEGGGDRRFAFEAMIDLPIARGDIRDHEKAARASLRASEREAENVRLRLRAAIGETARAMEAAAASIDLHRNGMLPQAESAFRSARAAYAAGRLDFESLLLAERSLLEAESGLHDMVARFGMLLARLDRLVGSKDEDTLFPLRDAARGAADPRKE